MSGIYIPGMEMPESCRICKIEQGDSGYWWCGAVKKFKPTQDFRESRPEWCPLVSVSPHDGDLIERDALKRNWRPLDAAFGSITEMQYNINRAPAVIPADPIKEATE